MASWFEVKAPSLGFNALLAAASLGSLWYLFEFRPLAFALLFREDGWAELASFAAWTLASVLWLRTASLRPPTTRWVLVGAALLAALAAAEEISWGQRIFGWDSPEFFDTANRQAETNLHNLEPMAPLIRLLPWLVVGLCVVGWAIARWLPRVGRRASTLRVPIVPPHLWPFFVAAALAMSRLFLGGREAGELLLALAACGLATESWRSSAPRWSLSGRATAALTLLLVVPLLTCAAAAITPPPHAVDPARLATTFILGGRYERAERLLTSLDGASSEGSDDIQLLRAMSLQGMGRADDAARQARALVERVLSGAEPTNESLERLSTPQSAQTLALCLCLLERRQEAVLALGYAQSMDLARLQAALDPDDEAIVRASLAASLHGLAFEGLGNREMRKSLKRAHSLRGRQRAYALFIRMRHLVSISRCDLTDLTKPAASNLPGAR